MGEEYFDAEINQREARDQQFPSIYGSLRFQLRK